MGKAQVDSDTTGFFFFVCVAVDAGECTDQRSLAMIDMAGGTHDQILTHAAVTSR